MAAFLANENVPYDAILAARGAGLDIAWIKEFDPGASDPVVMRHSLAQSRVLVTFDKDFGQLVFLHGATASAGIILMRPKLRTAAYLARFVTGVLTQTANWNGHFAVATEGRLRLIPLP